METIYGVRDTAGVLVAEHVRVDLPDGKRMYWQRGDAAGLGGLPTSDLPLYGSEILSELVPGQTVLVCEGERAAGSLWPWRVPALGTVTGAAGTPGEDALAPLLPFDVVLWPDHDEPGEAHMTRVAARLIRLGGRARRLDWGHEKGDDAADFVERGGTRTQLRLLVDAATAWEMEVPPKTAVRPARSDFGATADRVGQAREGIVAVIQRRLGDPARRQGRSWFWHCPFHAGDREPSFKVDLQEPFYRCFGCDAKGDVFSFVQRLDGRSFKETLAVLAPASIRTFRLDHDGA